jgi:hypothetical protein
MATKTERAAGYDAQRAAVIAVRGIQQNQGKANACVAADQVAGETCVQTIARMSGIKP